MVWFTFTKANRKQTRNEKLKSCAQNAGVLLARQLGGLNAKSLLTSVDYFHASIDLGVKSTASIADGTYDRIEEEGTAGDERLWWDWQKTSNSIMQQSDSDAHRKWTKLNLDWFVCGENVIQPSTGPICWRNWAPLD